MSTTVETVKVIAIAAADAALTPVCGLNEYFMRRPPISADRNRLRPDLFRGYLRQPGNRPSSIRRSLRRLEMALGHCQPPTSGRTCRRVALRGGIVVIVGLAGLFASSCSVVKAATKVVHDVEGNKAKIDAFTHKVQAGESATFEATYQPSGTAPAAVVYAVEKPNLLFRDTPSGSGNSSNTFDIIVNPSGE